MSTEWSLRPAEVRFWEKVRKGPGCWEWLGATNPTKGHGFFKFNGKQTGAHRVAWILAYGSIPAGHGYHGTCVCHRCDNPRCVRPDHLFLGTIQDNLTDMRAKGRERHVRGDAHGSRTKPHLVARGSRISRKLTEADVIEIRKRLANGETQVLVARHYGVLQSTISFIATRRTWKHVA